MEYFERWQQFWTGKKITTTDNTRHNIVSALSQNEWQIRLRPNALTKLYSPKYGFKEKDINDMWSYVWRNINTFLDTIVKFLEENQGIIWKNEIMSTIRDIPNSEFIHEWKFDTNIFKKFVKYKAILQKNHDFTDKEINELFDSIEKYGDYSTIAKKNLLMWEVINKLDTSEDNEDYVTKSVLFRTINTTTPDTINAQIKFLKEKSGRLYSRSNILLKIATDRQQILDLWFPESVLSEWLGKADKWFEMQYLKNIKKMLTSDNCVDVNEVLDVIIHIKRDLVWNKQYIEKKKIKVKEWIKKMDPVCMWNYILIKRNQYDISREDMFDAIHNCKSLDDLAEYLPQIHFEWKKWQNINSMMDVMRLTVKEWMFNNRTDNNAMRHAWETRSTSKK